MTTESILVLLVAILLITNIMTLALVGYMRQQLKELTAKQHIERFDEVP